MSQMITLTDNQIDRLKKLASTYDRTVTDIEIYENRLVKFYVTCHISLRMSNSDGYTFSRKEVAQYILENIDECDVRSVIRYFENEQKEILSQFIQGKKREFYSSDDKYIDDKIKPAIEKVLEDYSIKDVRNFTNNVVTRITFEIRWSDFYLDDLRRDIETCKKVMSEIQEEDCKKTIAFNLDTESFVKLIDDNDLSYVYYAYCRTSDDYYEYDDDHPFEEIFQSEYYQDRNYEDEFYDEIVQHNKLIDSVIKNILKSHDLNCNIRVTLNRFDFDKLYYEIDLDLKELLDDKISLDILNRLDQQLNCDSYFETPIVLRSKVEHGLGKLMFY